MPDEAGETTEYQRCGLYDPRAPNASDRLALLEWLRNRGVSIEQMVEANAVRSLPALAGDLEIRGGGALTVAEVAERAEVPVALVERVINAAGIPTPAPDERVLSEADEGTIRLFSAASDLFGEASVLRFTRVAGTSIAHVAEAAIWTFLSDVERPIVQEARGELALAQANLAAAETLNLLPQVMDTLMRGHAEAAIRRSRQSRSHGVYDTARMAVGFVDLVGFTSFSEHHNPAEITSVVDAFEERAFGVVTRNDGRLVKLIGDEVMFVAVDAEVACTIALDLLEAFGDTSDVTPRGGLAYGDLVVRAGDYFGPVVNLASRAAELAVPSEMLVTSAVADAAGDAVDLAFVPAGRRMLKGFSDPVELFAVSRAL